MARGSKEKYTSKQKRQARHIEDSARKSGKSKEAAERIAWATVNKETGGAGRSVRNTSPSRKGGHKAGSSQSRARRSAAARKGWRTRKQEPSSHAGGSQA